MSESIRQKKLASLLQKELSNFFLKKAPYHKQEAFINVPYAKISADLSIARIHLSIFPSEKAKEILNEIQEKKGEIKKTVAHSLKNRFKKFPELYFYLDDSFDKIKAIEEALEGKKENPFNLL